MTTFTIDTDNNITAHPTAAEAKAVVGAERFGNEAALAKLAAAWPAARLVEIFNSLTGVTPVKKFKDRNAAAARIWNGIQSLVPADETDSTDAPVAPQSANVAPEEATAGKKPARTKKAPKAAKEAKAPRTESKGAKLLGLIARPQGATLAELMAELGWQAHSVRGFISTAGKKVAIESAKNESCVRVYKTGK